MSGQLRADLAAGAHLCMFGTAASHCAEPATVHVWPSPMSVMAPTMDCDAHYVAWWATRPHDAHPTSGACGLPGTTWYPERCRLDGVSGIAEQHVAVRRGPHPRPAHRPGGLRGD